LSLFSFGAKDTTLRPDMQSPFVGILGRVSGLPLLCDSDAHYLENIPEAAAWLDLEECTIPALFAVLKGEKACAWGRD